MVMSIVEFALLTFIVIGGLLLLIATIVAAAGLYLKIYNMAMDSKNQ